MKKSTDGLYYIKEDHLIVSNNLKTINDIAYEWDCVCQKNGYAGLTKFDYKSENSGLPDHAKLLATINVHYS